MSSLFEQQLTQAQSFFESQNHGEAQKILSALIEEQPDNAKALKLSGNIYINVGRHDLALPILEKSAQADSKDSKTHNLIGICHQKFFNHKEAERSFRKAVEFNPQYAAAQSNFISTLEKLNKVSDSREQLEIAKTHCPDSPLFVLREATILKREKKNSKAIQLLEKNTYPQDPQSKLQALNLLGHLYDADKKYDTAFSYFNKFNSLGTEIYNINDQTKSVYLKKIEEAKKTFTPEFVQSLPPAQPNKRQDLSFLFGFSRSGTTLLQHILSSHPKIHATEEIPAMPRIIETLEQQIGNYPQCLANLTNEQIKQLQSSYFQLHQEDPDWQDKELLIDKYPFGTSNIGISHFLFPDAKFIFVARHPCDCILSSYFQFFTPNEGMIHTYNLEDTVTLYCKLMDIWQAYESVLPLQSTTIRYEDVVEDMPKNIQTILSFLDIEWNNSVLNHIESVKKRGNIRTPSYNQVSQNIYKNSKYRWLNYKKEMEPYLEKLQPYIHWLGYE